MREFFSATNIIYQFLIAFADGNSVKLDAVKQEPTESSGNVIS